MPLEKEQQAFETMLNRIRNQFIHKKRQSDKTLNKCKQTPKVIVSLPTQFIFGLKGSVATCSL